MLTIPEARSLVSLLVPAYFQPSVDAGRVRSILERTFASHSVFCRKEATLVIVDAGTTVERVFREAHEGSPLDGLSLLTLAENHGKTGAVAAGLRELLQRTEAPFVVTQDCDGDNMIEDLPQLVSMGVELAEASGDGVVSVFGARPSLEKPMNWEREQWERLTNDVVVDLVQYLLARQEKVLDRRFWNGYPLDLQSGYRLYSRSAAALAADSLSILDEGRDTYLLACETLPFLALSLNGGIVGQVMRNTLIEQPVSSYSHMPFGCYYGKLLAFMGRRYGIPVPILRQVFDNHLVASSAYFSRAREQFEECRNYLDPGAPPVQQPSFL